MMGDTTHVEPFDLVEEARDFVEEARDLLVRTKERHALDIDERAIDTEYAILFAGITKAIAEGVHPVFGQLISEGSLDLGQAADILAGASTRVMQFLTQLAEQIDEEV